MKYIIFLLALVTTLSSETIIGNIEAPVNGNFAIAHNRWIGFQFTIGNQDVSVGSVDFGGRVFGQPPIGDLSAAFYNDVSSNPGDIIQNGNLVTPEIVQTVNSIHNFQLASPLLTLVAGTTYWLVLQSAGNYPDTAGAFVWNSTPVDPVGDLAFTTGTVFEYFLESTDQGNSWNTFSGANFIFNINTNGGGSAPIPEPSTYIALLLGLISLGVVYKRR